METVTIEYLNGCINIAFRLGVIVMTIIAVCVYIFFDRR